MRIYNKTLTEFTETDLQQLVDDGQEETLRIDFKVDCYDFTDEDTKKAKRIEFCKDVLALANASGGWIFCGIAETKGRASKLVGLENFNSDDVKRRLGQWLDIDAEPRVGQLNTHTITLSDGKAIFIIEVPRSFAAPHRNKQTNDFPLRREARTDPMTIDDLRRAFVGGANYVDQIRSFRQERVKALLDPSHPDSYITLQEGPLLIIHVMPLGMIEGNNRIVFPQGFVWNALHDIDTWRTVDRAMPNLDGYLIPRKYNTEKAWGYLQVFRSGAIEYAAVGPSQKIDQSEAIHFHEWERDTLKGLIYCIRLMKVLELQEPCYVGVTLARIVNFSWSVFDRSGDHFIVSALKHNPLFLPEHYIEDWAEPIPSQMKPLFDIWANALGQTSSGNFNTKGDWIGRASDSDLPSINPSN